MDTSHTLVSRLGREEFLWDNSHFDSIDSILVVITRHGLELVVLDTNRAIIAISHCAHCLHISEL